MYGASRSDLYCGVPSAEPIEEQYIDNCIENQYPSSLLALLHNNIILLCSQIDNNIIINGYYL